MPRLRVGKYALQLSDSEELDVVSANTMYTEDSPPQSYAYKELVEVVTRAVERLKTEVWRFSPDSSSSARSPVLPTKPVRTTSALVGKAYSVAGQAAACLLTMTLLQGYQADLLADLDEGEGIGPDTVCELRQATDLSLRATKEMPRSIGRSMAALVATERHLII